MVRKEKKKIPKKHSNSSPKPNFSVLIQSGVPGAIIALGTPCRATADFIVTSANLLHFFSFNFECTFGGLPKHELRQSWCL